MSNQQENNCFHIINPDYSLSPHTGLTRNHWFEAAEYLLQGAFSHIHSIHNTMCFPKQKGKTYPIKPEQIPIENLEGFCRTLFIAIPLLKKEPNLTINGIPIAEFYQKQILNILDRKSDLYIAPRTKTHGEGQILVEFGALAISLFLLPEILWDIFTREQQKELATLMLSYGQGPTIPSNWMFFNVFIMSFFKNRGYRINESLLKKHLRSILKRYRGEGWYNDDPAYDFYSMWSFQLYGILWSHYFGKKEYPKIAKKLIKNFQDIICMYPHLFSKEGEMMMYGRSISYRFASVSPFPFTALYSKDETNHGWLRRIASSTLLQFLQHPGFLKNGVPTLGFYDAFEPAVQNYNCRGSVYWMGKAFLGLLLPEKSSFWTDKENNDVWEQSGTEIVRNYYSSSTNILITNYSQSGASEIRAWCHNKEADDWQKFRSSENYNRLSYSTLFPWQADGPSGETAMNYAFMVQEKKWEVFRLYTFKSFKDGIYQRYAVLETDEDVRMLLSDIPLPGGILRIDKNLSKRIVKMRLGHYGLPELDSGITMETRKYNDFTATIIDNGEYQLAMVLLFGWEKIRTLTVEGVHPEKHRSILLEAEGVFHPNSQRIYALLQLWKNSEKKWSDEELFPVRKLHIAPRARKVRITFADDQVKTVKF